MSDSKVKQWFDTAAGNNTGSPPDYATEGWAPSQVNDWARQAMADIRLQFEDGGWFNWGHTITYVGANDFQVTGAHAAVYPVGRRVRAEGSLTGTIYGTISAVAVGSNTDVTVSWDSGSLQSETLEVSVGPDPENDQGVSEADLIGTQRTFTKVQVPGIRETANVADGTAITWDMTSHQTLQHTIDSASAVTVTLSNPVKGASYRLVLIRSTTGFGWTPSGITPDAGDNIVSIDNAAGKTVAHFYCDATGSLLYEGQENYT